MLELPEVAVRTEELRDNIVGKRVKTVLPPVKEHKFCWFNGDPAEYGKHINGSIVQDAQGFGIYVELEFENGYKLCVNDGVTLFLTTKTSKVKNYQLLIEFEDDTCLVLTVAMYGGIILHDGSYDNEYYMISRQAPKLLSKEFKDNYERLLEESKPNLSAKALLATKQRIPGIGNGVLQDILFAAKIHPKRKLATFSEEDKERLFHSIINVLSEMTVKGGRDTEKNIFGEKGGYQTVMSKNTASSGCPNCGGPVTKEAYLGGSVYYCASCQPLVK